ncbi:MAG: hypothetical protein JO345_36585 [Streptosporangiaceae bacterium]|nr:hypothetical protein [Streptosporangiaceae bacterium]
MRPRRIVPGILATAAAAALGLTITAASSASASTVTPKQPAAPKQNIVVLNCLGKPQVEPKSFVLTCADGNSYLTGLSWTSWTPKLASATGALIQNDCRPTCVGGHFHRYPVLAVLWGPVRYAHAQRYNELTLIFPGARPLFYNGHQWVPGPQTITSPLWGPPR